MTNLHPETTEDIIYDVFEEYAPITKMHLNYDKHTGFVKGYALLQFKELEDTMNVFSAHKESKITVLGLPVEIDYAFVTKPGSEIKDEEFDGSAPRIARVGAASLRERLGLTSRDTSPSR